MGTMSMISPQGPRHSYSSSSSYSRPVSAQRRVSTVTVITAVVLLGVFAALGAFQSAFFGALAGVVSAWLQRGFRIHNKVGLSLVESLITSRFWTEAPKTAAVQVLLGALAGVVAAGVAGWVGLPIGAYHISTVMQAGVGGGEPPIAGALLGFILIIVFACVIVYLIINPLIARRLLDELFKGGVESVSGKVVASLFLHESSETSAAATATGKDLGMRMLWPSAVEGAITGGSISLILIICGLG